MLNSLKYYVYPEDLRLQHFHWDLICLETVLPNFWLIIGNARISQLRSLFSEANVFEHL